MTTTTPLARTEPLCAAHFATQLAAVQAIAQYGGQADFVFLGDSITQGWQWTGSSWARDWLGRKSLNLGIGGDLTQHLLYRVLNGAIDGIAPRLLVQLIGVNNLWTSATAAEVTEGVVACAAAIRLKQPAARILVLGILPCAGNAAGKNAIIADINAAVARRAPGLPCDFLDVGYLFQDERGVVAQHWMPDDIHLSSGAYDRLAAALRAWIDAHLA